MKSGFKSSTAVLNNVLDMYIKCGAIEEARLVFDRQRKRDAASWKTMILGYADSGCDEEALGLFSLMCAEGIEPDSLTFTGLLNACARLSCLNEGKYIHTSSIMNGHGSDVYVCGAIVNMYAKCGSIEDAFNVFKKLPEHDVVSWNSMILGFFQNGCSDTVLQLFCAMQRACLTPSAYTFVCTLNACAGLGAMHHGEAIHAHVTHHGIETKPFIGSALIDMYAKAGSLIDAHHVFIKMLNKEVVPWTTMILGFARHGCSNDAIMLFEQMLEEGVKPTKATYAGILVACTHSGLLDEGFWYFNTMGTRHDIPPSMDHYACVVDLLSRAGLTEEAEKFVHKMPHHAQDEVWMTLFSASKIHEDLGLAERAVCAIAP
jgi:pentatricopeptide repeat protein